MRCRVGDLCLIVGGTSAGNYCTTIAYDPLDFHEPSGIMGCWEAESCSPLQTIDRWSGFSSPQRKGCIPDEWLKPIRDNDGTDEMIRTAGKPQETVRDALVGIRELLELK